MARGRNDEERKAERKRGSSARWATFWIILFMVLVPFFESLDPTGTWTTFIGKWMFVVLLVYIGVEFYETTERSVNNTGGYIKDNGLSFIAFIISVVTFALMVAKVGPYILTEAQLYIMLQLAGWNAIDFILGLLMSQRIARAGRERDEE